MNEIPYAQIGIALAIAVIYLALRLRRNKNKSLILASLQAGAKVIDVRSPSEFAGGHFQGALNIPVDKLSQKMKGLGPKETPIIVYCASGGRSAVAANTLRSAGFSQVLNAGPLSAMPSI